MAGMIGKVTYMPSDGQWRCILLISWEPDTIIMHMVGMGWGPEKVTARASALSFARDALSAAKGETTDTHMIARFLYSETGNACCCHIIAFTLGDHVAHDVARGWGWSKAEAADAAISFGERALEAAERA
jgi:hypothetical protein